MIIVNINPADYCGELYDISVDGNTYYRDEFQDPDAGEISINYNSDLFYEFNEGTYLVDGQTSNEYTFRFNEPGYIYISLKNYTDEIDHGQEVISPDIKIVKSTLINNTGMQWIKED